MKPDKGNGVVILDRKLYDNAIQELILDTSKFEKLNEDPTLKREASLQRFLCKLKQKNFCDLLSPLAPNDYSCKDTFSFVSQIKNANIYKKFLVSYDVTSLFTNIPLQETMDIAINLIFNHNPNLNITKKELKKLFLFATSQTHFIFNSKFYDQIDGVAWDLLWLLSLLIFPWVFTNLSG